MGIEGHEALNDVLIFLLAAVTLVPLFHKFKLGSILGYLFAGILIGPHGFKFIKNIETAHILAELGVIFLLFNIGLGLSLERLNTMKSQIFGLGLLQVVLTGAALAGICYKFGDNLGLSGINIEVAIIIGFSLALSSTAFVVQLLVERGEQFTRFGRVTLSILLFQDLAIVPLLILLPVFAQENSSVLAPLALAIFNSFCALVLIIILGRWVFRPIYRIVAATSYSDLFAAVTLLIILGTGWLLSQSGITMVLGAFLAGIILAETEYRHQIESDIRPFRGILLGLFFISIGMYVNLNFLLDNVWYLLAMAVGIMVIKTIFTYILCVLFGFKPAVSTRTGMMLSQGGEFSFILFGSAMTIGFMDNDLGQKLIAIVIVSLSLTPLMSYLSLRLIRAFQDSKAKKLHHELISGEDNLQDHVVITGFGRVGRAIANILTTCKIPYVAFDIDHKRVDKYRNLGVPIFFGDATQIDLLNLGGVDKAKAIVITLDKPHDALVAVQALRVALPELPIFVRAKDKKHREILKSKGATAITPEINEASLQLASNLLAYIGFDEDKTQKLMHSLREDEYSALENFPIQPKTSA